MNQNDTTPNTTADPRTVAEHVAHLATTTDEPHPTHDADRLLGDSDTTPAELATEVAAELADHLSTPAPPATTTRSQEQYAALLLYQRALSLSQAELAARLDENAALRTQFNLDSAPTQQAISYAWRRRFTGHDRQVITAAAAALRRLTTRLDAHCTA